MGFENTLSSTADTADAAQSDTGSPVVVLQTADGPAVTRTVTLDTPTVDSAGLPSVVKSVFGEYHQRTQTVTETAADGTSVTSTEPVPGLAGLDWYWLSGVFLFTIVLWSFFRFLGVVFKR